MNKSYNFQFRSTNLVIFSIVLSIIFLLLVLQLQKKSICRIDSSDDALKKVLDLPEVDKYLERVENGFVHLDHIEDDGDYIIHVYEIVQNREDENGHSATYNWYEVKMCSGKIIPMFTN